MKKINDDLFKGYVCGVTKNPCCGCSLYCEHRWGPYNEKTEEKKEGERNELYTPNM